MKRKNRVLVKTGQKFLLFLWIVFFSACTRISPTPYISDAISSPTQAFPSTETPTPYIAPTATPTPTASVTPTPLPTSTQGYLPFPTPLPDTSLTRRCIPLSDWDVKQNPMGGKLVLDPEQTIWNWNHNPQVLDLSDGSLQSILTNWFPFKENISPDRERFFWIDENQEQDYDTFTLRSLDGTTLAERKWPKSWGLVAEWFDNNRLIIFPPRSEQFSYGTGVLYNPFNEKTTVLAPKFQDELNIDRLVISYQPAFHFALFYGGSDYVLYDLIENKDVIRNGFGDIFNKPVWSINGEKVYFVSRQDKSDSEDSTHLFTFTTKGIRNQLTSLGNSYKVEGTIVSHFQLSPDETKIAFTYALTNIEHDYSYPELAILDVATHEMVDTCLITPMDEAYWSPDGSKLAITIPVSLDNLGAYRMTRNAKLETYVAILDMKSWTGIKIPINNAVVGWMKD